jgi:predicted transcriptional regulator
MLPAECYEQIQALAHANQVSSAWVIRHALLRFLREQTGQLQLPLTVEDR